MLLPGDMWQSDLGVYQTVNVAVGFKFSRGVNSVFDVVKVVGTQLVGFSLEGAALAGASFVTPLVLGSAGGAMAVSMIAAESAAVASLAVVCPPCALGAGLTGAAMVSFAAYNGIIMISNKLFTASTERLQLLLRYPEHKLPGTRMQLFPLATLIEDGDYIAQGAIDTMIKRWWNEMRDDPEMIALRQDDGLMAHTVGQDGLMAGFDSLDSFRARLWIPVAVAKEFLNMLDSELESSFTPWLWSHRQLYLRGGLSQPSFNQELGGWLVSAFIPLYISEVEHEENAELVDNVACTDIGPDFFERLLKICLDGCRPKKMKKREDSNRLPEIVCEARCREKLSKEVFDRLRPQGAGVCRGIVQRKGWHVHNRCCSIGNKAEGADHLTDYAFPKFCTENRECRDIYYDRSDDEPWACAEKAYREPYLEVKKHGKENPNGESCWSSKVYNDQDEDQRNMFARKQKKMKRLKKKTVR
jgi:hypothetical protein